MGTLQTGTAASEAGKRRQYNYLLTKTTLNQSKSKPLVCMVEVHFPFFWAASQSNFLICLVTPWSDSGSTSAFLWLRSEGTLVVYWPGCRFDLILVLPSILTSMIPQRHDMFHYFTWNFWGNFASSDTKMILGFNLQNAHKIFIFLHQTHGLYHKWTSITQKWLVIAHYRTSVIDKCRQHMEVTNTETTHQLELHSLITRATNFMT